MGRIMNFHSRFASISLLFCLILSSQASSSGFFGHLPWLTDFHIKQMNYGIATADVDNDGDFEWIVAGFTGPNFVFKFNNATSKLENIAVPDSAYEALMDPKGRAIGVSACDIDGDGREEIYFLNTNNAYSGKSSYGDKLFKWRDGRFVDLFTDEVNSKMDAKNFAGRSVACVDRFGNGKYSFAIATYSHAGTGNFALVEMDETHAENDVDQGQVVLRNAAKEAGIDRATGGRGIAVGPIVSQSGKTDIFFLNEGNSWLKNPGSNFLFMNLGNGTFLDVAKETGVLDESENGRGVAVTDVNRDGLIDIIYGNWEGEHRLFLQSRTEEGLTLFENIATPEFAKATPIRTVIAADFDNDGDVEVFFNNLYSFSDLQPNKLFKVKTFDKLARPGIRPLDAGDATESDWSGTGGSVADLDHDGRLELILSHGEDQSQPLTVYRVNQGQDNPWLRVLVKTKFGAPARGALVRMTTVLGVTHTRVIDGGSGYLCQMEPVAHFGLGVDVCSELHVVWPDGRTFEKSLSMVDVNTVLVVSHPDTVSVAILKHSDDNNVNSTNQTVHLKGVKHEEL